MPIAMLNTTSIYYQISEASDPDAAKLLYIGGTGGDLRSKPNIFDSPLAKHFQILAYDQRGLGQTEAGGGPYTMAQYGDDAADLLAHVGWDKALVYGVSFGGMVAQHLALRHPECVERLVLACTSPGGENTASYPLHNIHELQGYQRFIFTLGIYDNRCTAQWQRENPQQVEKMWLYTEKQRQQIPVTELSKRGERDQIEARRYHDVLDQLGNISAATFICGGHFDDLAPPSNLEILQQRIVGSQLRFYQGGHLFMLQDPAAIEDILAFLQGSDICH
jgi:3-oxoadipate enol-lactonase